MLAEGILAAKVQFFKGERKAIDRIRVWVIHEREFELRFKRPLRGEEGGIYNRFRWCSNRIGSRILLKVKHIGNKRATQRRTGSPSLRETRCFRFHGYRDRR